MQLTTAEAEFEELRGELTRRIAEQALAQEQSQILAAIAQGAQLAETLSAVCAMIERHLPGVRCSIVLLDHRDGTLRHAVAPGLPQFYVEAIDGASIGPVAGNCGAACYHRAAAWAEDVERDPRWGPWLPLARSVGIRACYSCAVFSSTGSVLGSFALYWDHVHRPLPEDRRLVETGTALAAIAIERAQTEEAMAHAATHDSLTGLPNRACFVDRLRQALVRARRKNRQLAVLFMDLDRFKVVNDTLGHAAGDRLLVAVAHRLRAAMREGDTVARIGGDEFTVLCEDVDDTDAAAVLAGRLAEELSQPLRVGQHRFHVSASIGVTVGGPGSRPQDLLRDADIAMYRGKERGRGRIEIFDTSLLIGSRQRYDDESALRQVLDTNQLTLYYQPIVDLSTGHPWGMEALLRWRRGDGQKVPPTTIVALAEEIGLIHRLGAQVIAQAAAQLAELRRSALVGPEFCVNVNLASIQLTDPGLVGVVEEVLHANQMGPEQLCLELTESGRLEDRPETMEVLAALNGLGIRLALDDFGTGYSSVARLRTLPFEAIKIDRSFVTELGTAERSIDLFEGMLALGRALDMCVVAEGVETEGQLQILRDLGCQAAQGYWLARPQPPEQLARLLAGRPAW